MLDILEKKRSNGNTQNITINKKNRRTSLGLAVNSNRTFSEFKSIGKHVEAMDKSQANGRKIVTAVQRKN